VFERAKQLEVEGRVRLNTARIKIGTGAQFTVVEFIATGVEPAP
jgi:hypothetical protein